MNDRVLILDGPNDPRAKIAGLLDSGTDLVRLAAPGRIDVSYAELSDAELGMQKLLIVPLSRDLGGIRPTSRAADESLDEQELLVP